MFARAFPAGRGRWQDVALTDEVGKINLKDSLGSRLIHRRFGGLWFSEV